MGPQTGLVLSYVTLETWSTSLVPHRGTGLFICFDDWVKAGRGCTVLGAVLCCHCREGTSPRFPSTRAPTHPSRGVGVELLWAPCAVPGGAGGLVPAGCCSESCPGSALTSPVGGGRPGCPQASAGCGVGGATVFPVAGAKPFSLAAFRFDGGLLRRPVTGESSFCWAPCPVLLGCPGGRFILLRTLEEGSPDFSFGSPGPCQAACSPPSGILLCGFRDNGGV